MEITAALVKELREITGAGMMDAKKALVATDGDKEKAIDFCVKRPGCSRQESGSHRRRRPCVLLYSR